MTATFHVHNLGCKVNRVESDTFQAKLISRGAQAVSRAEARVVIINTCTVTAEADAKTRKAVRQALLAPLSPWVVVTGCSAMINPQTLTSLGERIVLEPDRDCALEKAWLLLDTNQGTGEGLSAKESMALLPNQKNPTQNSVLRVGKGFTTRVGIKIQDGCDNRCSYCIVPLARGAAVSVPSDHILNEIRAAAHAGAREFVLTGVNLGSYHTHEHKLVSLIYEALHTMPDIRIRLSSIEPLDVSKELLELMHVEKGRLCAHLHIPLQSGSDKILSSMRRPYAVSQFVDLVQRAQMLLPHISLTTDMIVGFPGESDEDFNQSVAVCEQVGFSKIHVFRYSRRPGTLAEKMEDHIPSHIKAARARNLRLLADRLAAKDASKRVGTVEQVLVENPRRATSESYHTVELLTPRLSGSLIPVQFSASRASFLLE